MSKVTVGKLTPGAERLLRRVRAAHPTAWVNLDRIHQARGATLTQLAVAGLLEYRAEETGEGKTWNRTRFARLTDAGRERTTALPVVRP